MSIILKILISESNIKLFSIFILSSFSSQNNFIRDQWLQRRRRLSAMLMMMSVTAWGIGLLLDAAVVVATAATKLATTTASLASAAITKLRELQDGDE